MSGKIAKSYWTALQFSVIFFFQLKSSCEENILHLYLKFAPVDSQSCMFHDKFYRFEIIMYHHFNSVNISSHVWNLFTFGTRCRHTYRIKDHTIVPNWYHVNHFCLLSYALKFWNCESFYRLEIGSSQLINWLIVQIY